MCFIKAPKVVSPAIASAPPAIAPPPIETADDIKEAGQDTRKIKRRRTGRDSLRIKRNVNPVNIPGASAGVNL